MFKTARIEDAVARTTLTSLVKLAPSLSVRNVSIARAVRHRLDLGTLTKTEKVWRISKGRSLVVRYLATRP